MYEKYLSTEAVHKIKSIHYVPKVCKYKGSTQNQVITLCTRCIQVQMQYTKLSRYTMYQKNLSTEAVHKIKSIHYVPKVCKYKGMYTK